jgi:type II restriction enzyme
VNEGEARPISEVRNIYQATRPLAKLQPTVRGWTLDVLRMIDSLGSREFTLKDLYAREVELQPLHPRNRNIRPKIRQQLQVLRDLGFVLFRGHGTYTRWAF